MAITGPVSAHSLLRFPYFAGRISQLGASPQVLSSYYGAGLGIRKSGGSVAVRGGNKRSQRRTIVYDIFNATRLTATGRAPGTGPARIKPHPIGTMTVRGIRFYDSRVFNYEDLRDYRPQGAAPGTLDRMGQDYIGGQVDNLIQRNMNTREFCFVNMLKGGFGLVVDGENLYPVPFGQGTFNVDYKLPASHKSQLALGPSAADLIDATWAAAGTDIISQLHKLRAISVQRSGLPVTEVWMNSIMWPRLMKNTGLQAAGGSALRVFESWAQRKVSGPNADPRLLDVPVNHTTYQIRAIPEFNFHVYDGGLTIDPSNPGSVMDSDTDNWVKFIGDNEVLITPPPTNTEWYDSYEIMEHVQEQYETQPKEVHGFYGWNRREPDPVPSVDCRALDNFAFALTIPNAVYNPTVVFG